MKSRKLLSQKDTIGRVDRKKHRGENGTGIAKKSEAMEEKGADIEQLLSLGKEIVNNTRTLSVAISPGTSPITGEKSG